jgi:HSP20 family molecular chaperone IbpA
MNRKQEEHEEFQMRENEKKTEYRHKLDTEVRKIEFERKFQLKDHFNENHEQMNHRRGLGRGSNWRRR